MAKAKKAAKKQTNSASRQNKSPNAHYSSSHRQGSSYQSRSSHPNSYSSQKAPKKGKRKSESGLEKKVNKLSKKETKQAMVSDLRKKGLSREQAEKFASLYERSEISHDMSSVKEYLSKIKQYKGVNLKELIKGAWYLGLALTDISPNENPYKQIKEGAAVIYLPGFLSIPSLSSVKEFEKHLGRKTAYVKTTDIDQIHKIISAAYEQHGKVQVIGFSDGGPVLDRYLHKYGDDKLDRAFMIAANPATYNSSRITQIVGKFDMLAPAEKEYLNFPSTKNVHGVYGGHTYFVHDKRTMQETADVINSYGNSRTYYLPGVQSVSHRHESIDLKVA